MTKLFTQVFKIATISLLLICLISCEKDEPVIHSVQTEQSQETKVKRIDFGTFKGKVSDSKRYKQLEKYLDLNNSKSKKSESLGSDSGIIVLTDEIIEIRQDNFNFYTFKVITYSFQNRFYNLVVKVNKEGEIVISKFLEYQPSDEWLGNTSQPFTGYVKLIENDFFDADDVFSTSSSNQPNQDNDLSFKSSKSSSTGMCVDTASGEWECNEGNNHAPDEGTTCTAWEYIITVTYSPCPASIDAGDSGNGGYPVNYDSGTGGGDPGTPTGGTPTIPTPPCDTQKTGLSGGDGCITSIDKIEKNNLVEYLNSNLNYQQVNWINNSSSIEDIVAINDYLAESDFRNLIKYKAFAIEAIKALMNDGDIDMYNRLVYNPAIAQDYRVKMSAPELQLFDQLNVFQKEGYLRAATQAYIYSESHFPQPVRNRLGDAFKHTFWNALSTIYITESITEQLTTAHEDIPYNYTNHFKETQMDLHNNAQGRQIAYGPGRIVDLVEQAMNNGDLRYLNHLELSGSFWRATDNSVLIPTNE